MWSWSTDEFPLLCFAAGDPLFDASIRRHRPGDGDRRRGENGAPDAEKTAVTVLIEEAQKRTGMRWKQRPAGLNRARWSWRLRSLTASPADIAAPDEIRKSVAGLTREGYVIATDVTRPERPVVWIVGADARGSSSASASCSDDEADEGYGDPRRANAARHVAGLSDPRPPARLPQSRQLVGRLGRAAVRAVHPRAGDSSARNCVENIPFQDDSPGPLMRVPRTR